MIVLPYEPLFRHSNFYRGNTSYSAPNRTRKNYTPPSVNQPCLFNQIGIGELDIEGMQKKCVDHQGTFVNIDIGNGQRIIRCNNLKEYVGNMCVYDLYSLTCNLNNNDTVGGGSNIEQMKTDCENAKGVFSWIYAGTASKATCNRANEPLTCPYSDKYIRTCPYYNGGRYLNTKKTKENCEGNTNQNKGKIDDVTLPNAVLCIIPESRSTEVICSYYNPNPITPPTTGIVLTPQTIPRPNSILPCFKP